MKWKIPLRLTSARTRLVLFALLGITIIGGAWSLLARSTPTLGDGSSRSVTATVGTIEEIIAAQGKLEPKEYVDVGAQVSGQLKTVHVDVGDTVTNGQLLAEIDPRIAQAQVGAAGARLKSLQALLVEQKGLAVLAQQNFRRNQKLIPAKAASLQSLQLSQAQATTAQARVVATQARLEEAQSNVEETRANLGFTKIYAPMAGIVTTRTAQGGQTLIASQTAPIILQIAKLDTMTVRAQVAEADVPRLTPGLPAYFSTLGQSDSRWQGTVRQILPAPEVLNDVVLYHALIDVKNQDRRLMTGMTARVFFVLGKAENVLTIPAEALSQRVPEQDSDSGKAYRVRVLTSDGPQDRVIHTGLQTRTQAQVTAGLAEGERILLELSPDAEASNSPRRGAGDLSRGLGK